MTQGQILSKESMAGDRNNITIFSDCLIGFKLWNK